MKNFTNILKLKNISPYLITFLSGVGMGLTPAPIYAFPLGWVALTPLWLLVSQTPWKKAALYGLLWGIGYYGLSLAWITGIHPMTWLGVPWLGSILIALFCWGFITLWGATLAAVWGGVFSWVTKKKNVFWRVFFGVALWCILEAIWRSSPLWWSSVAYTQSPYNLIILHLGRISGTTTVTAAIITINGLLAEGCSPLLYSTGKLPFSRTNATRTHQPRCLLSLAISLTLVFHLIGFWLYQQPLTDQTPLKVGIIQGNIPNEIKLNYQGWRKAIAGYTKGYRKLAQQGAEVILTPETALPYFWDEKSTLQKPFYRAILEQGVPVWVGAYGHLPGETATESYTNSLFMVTGEGKTISRYDKVKLVPLGEYIPAQRLLGQFINRLSPLEATLVPGHPSQEFNSPFGKAIAGICYESAFDYHFQRQLARGGEFIITASNNAHYSSTMPAQHHALDVMRAIESDRWAARATNTGYSAIVTPHGHTLWISDINTYETHLDTIYRRTSKTLYGRWGDWFGVGLGIFLVSYILISNK